MGNKQAKGKVRGEEAIIQGLLAPLAAGHAGAFGLQDDCALIAPEPDTELVLKTDPVAEGVHFLAGDAPEDIAWKALAVNVSDIAAKGARPIGYLMALSFPEAPETEWLTRFAAGLREAQERFGCHLLGGDTDRRPGPLTISVTIVGSVARGQMVRRGTARVGDAVFVSGTLGDAALGLALRKNKELAATWALTSLEAGTLIQRYVRPEPRLALGAALRDHASAAMDISDGLAKDLTRMCRASACGAHVQVASLPVSAACQAALGADPGLVERVVAGGDDYEVLAAVPAAGQAAFANAAESAGIPVAHIGFMTPGNAVRIDGRDGRPLQLQDLGWDHF